MANITLTWKGKAYTIPEKKAFEVGDEIEDVLTLYELAAMGERPKFHKLAKCFGIMLRFAGCKVSDRDVHSEMMRQIKDGAGEDMVAANAINALMAVLLDGAPEVSGEGDQPGKVDAS